MDTLSLSDIAAEEAALDRQELVIRRNMEAADNTLQAIHGAREILAGQKATLQKSGESPPPAPPQPPREIAPEILKNRGKSKRVHA